MIAMTKRFFPALASAILLMTGSLQADITFDDLFHCSATSAERAIGAEHTKVLQEAVEDYNAVLHFKPPIHAQLDKEAPVPADGGTLFYQGKGYQLTVAKSLFTMSGAKKENLHGYLYGPELTLKPELGVGNAANISNISFYPTDTLNQLLKR